ncbi:cyclic pyranopterin monophosphate synthase MoaC [Geobacillus sp. FSL K6-0789]|uniref:Cyclic pyranopterin monophosphate synthase n=1 Tax=Geobacillus stearothermophilus TaxID=1422 RepID=A0A0K9HQP5_GEOSE|nr:MULTISPECIES: cyclic pyranopterin monophosphate synthase MoaC [Geobacillus]AKU26957.1 molybdenum cofactor biosynthesis protein C [Geobacillus sp. LC300]KMY59307.1 molybdenum cofactor biosynthesis protein C [Geobacillus stearothermophilus]KMY59995.1 molybdenum cofactor biosynthesis protein C [Geobacillus stearothermophilus]KMY61211.1 molybdenum cofactor biosynthesis protein C [Geobacillus stearothermophilus]KOR94670.1 molybdenum cofactor biosynthesis protein C [Geobacillus stearothermophilus
MSSFTHFNEQGRAKMVDITNKEDTIRIAVARTSVTVNEEIYEKMTNNAIEKGDVLAVAQVAGVMAAKKTADLIPMCHPLMLKGVDIAFAWEKEAEAYKLVITVTVKTKGSTGVEMEALTAASVCALTVYDMCKSLDKGMTIGPTYLVEKTGGKSGHYRRKTD